MYNYMSESKKNKLDTSGYKIRLKTLDKSTIKKIKSDLTVSPLNSGYSDKGEEKYQVYHEDEKYITIPRYYGIKNFGEPKHKFKPQKVNIKFTGNLRDYQNDIINKSLEHIKKYGGGLISVPCGMGKCLAKGTKILMFDGTIKNVEDIVQNDLLMGDDSTSRNVLSICTGEEEMYKITDVLHNEEYIVNKSHVLSLKIKNSLIMINDKYYDPTNTIDISLEDYLKLPLKIQNELYGFRVPISFKNNDTDGNIKKTSYCHAITSDKMNIPEIYKYGSEMTRLLYLTGLIDKYGDIYTSGKFFPDNQIHLDLYDVQQFVDDTIFLIRSLGYNCKKEKSKKFVDIATIKIFGNNLNKILKNSEEFNEIKEPIFDFTSLYYKINVNKVDLSTYYGFELDGNGRFVLGDFTVTHNTTMAINIASQLGLKTLVITHKSFLQDQWVDRCKQFTESSVGTIRQSKVDTENKDFVIGMIQSISKRDYGNIFKEYGTIIIDECHHFSSKHFSNALFKLGTKYTIGLSATPYRADGLMRVTNWFLGDIMYQIKIRTNNQVVAKIINYYTTNKLFTEKKRFRKGVGLKVDVVKMITNLLAIDERNQHIVDIIDEIRKDPERKILILSERKNHLKILKDKVDESIHIDVQSNKLLKDECKTYYYTGDLKQKERVEAEKYSDILFGTYQMANEGLDIDRLNTIVLASPKKDVVQSVGRILRKVLENGDIRPLIIDMSDNLSMFPNQASKRETYYKKSKYIINYYYLYNDKIVSTKQYHDNLKIDNKFNDDTPTDYSEILKVPIVEIKLDDVSESPKSQESQNSAESSESQESYKPEKNKKLSASIFKNYKKNTVV